MKQVSIIGVGLIGGSFALDLKHFIPEVHITGIDQNETHLTEAISLGIVDQIGSMNSLKTADLVVLAIPVNAALKILPQVLNLISDQAVVIDMGSTKEAICKAVSTHPRRAQFLATHPIAGTEFSGPSAAINGLFKNKTNIICEVEKTLPNLGESVLSVFKTMGMHLRFMAAKDHDKHIAYVSHLSHISSFMLGKTVIEKEKNERNIFDMAGSGFESTVRLAKSSPDMWTPIFEQNKDNVIETLTEYIQNLNQFKAFMEKDDFEAVHNEMKNTNYIKQILKGIA
ncbi:MAG: prephenate dehydrogenase [Flavobacteriaceae bacterium]|jgi:prephenate dehydrogenase|nr:prephenate dehydrogenase [Flavobacteriaceae bacterium]MDG1285453.1 prephenate dehydrogenase [Flavobacteriaceae bacterium]